MAQYRVTLQVIGDDLEAPVGPVIDGRVMVVDPEDRRSFVREFGWLGHELMVELKRQWQVELATVVE